MQLLRKKPFSGSLEHITKLMHNDNITAISSTSISFKLLLKNDSRTLLQKNEFMGRCFKNLLPEIHCMETG